VVTVDEVRALALSFPRAYEALVRDQVTFCVGHIVFLALSRDRGRPGFGSEVRRRVGRRHPNGGLTRVVSF
jgi:hypothetical protein